MGTYFTNYEWVIPNNNAIVSTSSVEEVPSNEEPLINLTCNGVLFSSQKPYELVLRFTNVPFPTKDVLAGCYGTFCISKRVLNAVKVIKPVYDKETKELLLTLNLRQICTVKRATRFSFAVQLKDCDSCPTGCGSECVCTSYQLDCFKP